MLSESESSVERGIYKGGELTVSDNGTCASETWHIGLCWIEGKAEKKEGFLVLFPQVKLCTLLKEWKNQVFR